jgi:hypothetical protein
MIEVTLLRVTLRLRVLIRRVASVSFMRTALMASFVSNALEYFDHTGRSPAALRARRLCAPSKENLPGDSAYFPGSLRAW